MPAVCCVGASRSTAPMMNTADDCNQNRQHYSVGMYALNTPAVASHFLENLPLNAELSYISAVRCFCKIS